MRAASAGWAADRRTDGTRPLVSVAGLGHQPPMRVYSLESHRVAIELADRFMRVVRDAQPQVVLDAGAWDASLAKACAVEAPDAAIHAFEANPYVYEKKAAKVVGTGVSYHHLAVGAEVGAATFSVVRRAKGKDASPKTGSNSMRRRLSGNIEYEDIQVPMTTIDAFAEEHGLLGRSCALWVDLEGCAYEGLSGARRMLDTTLVIMVEVEARPLWMGQKTADDVEALLNGFGFVQIGRDQQFGDQYNVLYAPS